MRDSSPAMAPAAPSRAEIERAVARGRRLQGAAVQAFLAQLLRLLAAGLGRGAQRTTAGLPGRGHCCR